MKSLISLLRRHSNNFCLAQKASCIVLLSVALSVGPGRLLAGSATWSANPSSGDWNAPANWVPTTVPSSFSDTASFAQSSNTNVFITANTQIDGIVFNPGASAYTISSPAPFILTLSGAGVTNNSGIGQNVVTGVAAKQFGDVRFLDTATAGSQVTYTNSGGTQNNGFGDASGGTTEFRDTSTAGTAMFGLRGHHDVLEWLVGWRGYFR